MRTRPVNCIFNPRLNHGHITPARVGWRDGAEHQSRLGHGSRPTTSIGDVAQRHGLSDIRSSNPGGCISERFLGRNTAEKRSIRALASGRPNPRMQASPAYGPREKAPISKNKLRGYVNTLQHGLPASNGAVGWSLVCGRPTATTWWRGARTRIIARHCPEDQRRQLQPQHGGTNKHRRVADGQFEAGATSGLCSATSRCYPAEAAPSRVKGKPVAAPMVNRLLLGRRVVPGPASMAQDYGHLPGGVAAAGNDRLG